MKQTCNANSLPPAGDVFAASWASYPGTGPAILLLFAGWATVWVVTELLVFAFAEQPGTPLWTVLHLAYFFGTAFWEAAMISTGIARFSGESISVADVLRDYRLAARLVVIKFLLLLMFLPGLLLAVLPGLYVLARFGLAPYVVVHQACGPIEALQRSSMLSRGMRPRLALIFLFLIMFNIAGAALLGLGIIASVPMTILAGGFIYWNLIKT